MRRWRAREQAPPDVRARAARWLWENAGPDVQHLCAKLAVLATPALTHMLHCYASQLSALHFNWRQLLRTVLLPLRRCTVARPQVVHELVLQAAAQHHVAGLVSLLFEGLAESLQHCTGDTVAVAHLMCHSMAAVSKRSTAYSTEQVTWYLQTVDATAEELCAQLRQRCIRGALARIVDRRLRLIKEHLWHPSRQLVQKRIAASQDTAAPGDTAPHELAPRAQICNAAATAAVLPRTTWQCQWQRRRLPRVKLPKEQRQSRWHPALNPAVLVVDAGLFSAQHDAAKRMFTSISKPQQQMRKLREALAQLTLLELRQDALDEIHQKIDKMQEVLDLQQNEILSMLDGSLTPVTQAASGLSSVLRQHGKVKGRVSSCARRRAGHLLQHALRAKTVPNMHCQLLTILKAMAGGPNHGVVP